MAQLKNWLKTILISQLILLGMTTALRRQKRVAGGEDTAIDKAPSLVQIWEGGEMLCGGTLISPQHVVTAAHCFDDKKTRLTVVAGASKLTDKGVRSKVSNVIMPSTYNIDSNTWDIAVLKLETPLKGKSIEKAKLYEGADLKTGDPMRIFGWGNIKEDAEERPVHLQSAEVNIYNRNDCVKIYEKIQPLTSSMFCAAAKGKDACNGDSGGPAFTKGQLYGVISWGAGCANYSYPGTYTSIKNVKKFLLATLKM